MKTAGQRHDKEQKVLMECCLKQAQAQMELSGRVWGNRLKAVEEAMQSQGLQVLTPYKLTCKHTQADAQRERAIGLEGLS
jgi:hypothetical protein